MARIAGIDVPNNKQVRIGLTYIFGIGDSRAAKSSPQPTSILRKGWHLDEDALNRIRHVIEGQGGIEGDLRKDVSLNIKRLIEIQSYRGLRHRVRCPFVASAPTPTLVPAKVPARYGCRKKKATK